MERNSRPSRRKHELEPISVDEALSDSALTGMLSFLERAPTGDPLPWAVTKAGKPEIPAISNVSTVEDSSTVKTVLTEDVRSSEIAFTSTVEESSTVEDSNLFRTIEYRSTVEDLTTVETSSVQEQESPAKPIKARLMRATLVQHGHTPAEHLLYTTLWANGKPDTHIPNTRLARLGYKELTRLCNFSKRTLTSLIPVLVEKLAVEIVDGGDYDHTARCYRVWDMRALLLRREAAGMRWVLKNKGIRFVPGPFEQDSSTVEESSSDSRVDSERSCYSSVEDPAPVTVEEPATQLRKGRIMVKKTTPTPPELSQGLHTLLGFSLDDEAIWTLWNRCRYRASDCTPEEILYFVGTKMGILRRGGIVNIPGFLLTSIPKCFTGSSLQVYRAGRGSVSEPKPDSDEMYRAILEDANATDREREVARQVLTAKSR